MKLIVVGLTMTLVVLGATVAIEWRSSPRVQNTRELIALGIMITLTAAVLIASFYP
jgi:hypothetical protein